MGKKIVAVSIIGVGARGGEAYGRYIHKCSDKFRIVSLCDTNEERLEKYGEVFAVPQAARFTDDDAFFAEKRSDVLLVCTLDKMHVAMAKRGLALGYDILLEKPISDDPQELRELVQCAKKSGRTVMVCHVLRYTAAINKVKEILDSGAIGKIVSVDHTENVVFWHEAHSYVRGNWRRSEDTTPMIMAKCCHDLDLMVWLKSGVRPTLVSSFGGDFQFAPEKTPSRAGTRCMVDCPIEADCLYSARKHYIDHPDRWAFYVWDSLEGLEHPTLEDKIASLKGNSNYGRCVWKCDHTVVDHQSVMLQFADGATGTLNMIGGAAKPERNIHIIGTRGEIKGVFDDSRYVVRAVDTASEAGWREETVDLGIGGDKSGANGTHGGGDLRLVEDFVRVLQGKTPSISCTSIEDSVNGHLAVFRAEKARKTGTVVPLADEE